jgi:hypothetical protein
MVSRVAQSVWSLATDWTTGRSRFDPGRGQRIFPLATVSRLALGPTQPPVQCVPGVLSPGLKRGRGVTLPTHPHLVPRSRMSRSYTFSPLSTFMLYSGIAFCILLIIQSHSFLKSMLNRTSACLDYNTNPFLFPLADNWSDIIPWQSGYT